MTFPENVLDLHLAIQVFLREAGAFARREFLSFSAQHIEFKGTQNDMFSYVDVQTELMLKNKLSELLPGSGFINEEGANQKSENGYVWVIDPIDGTTNFIHGLPVFSICVALRQGEETLLGYVYDVMADELFAAIRGEGATRNGQFIKVSQVARWEDSLIATGFPYATFPWFEDYVKLISYVTQHTHGIRRLGSAAIDMVYVACGRLEGFFEVGLSPWDVAAGALIVEEAGGRVTDFLGEEDYIFGRQIVATNGTIHPAMLEVIEQRVGEWVKKAGKKYRISDPNV